MEVTPKRLICPFVRLRCNRNINNNLIYKIMTYILIEKNYDSKNKCFIESSTKITKSSDFRLLAKMQHESNYDYTSLTIKK